MDERNEEIQPSPENPSGSEKGAREAWVRPEVSRINAESAQAGAGDVVPDGTFAS